MNRIARLSLCLIVTISFTGLFPTGESKAALVAGPADYKLPYPAGKTYKLVRGNNEAPSHKGYAEYAFDFDLASGDFVVASRAGRVVFVKEDSDEGGPHRSYANKGNYVVIDHGDGTSALYLHLQKDGALAEVGQHVLQGQVIALSGATGWVQGDPPDHLHFQVQKTVKDLWYTQSIPIAFTDDKDNNGVPTVGNEYTSGNLEPEVPEYASAQQVVKAFYEAWQANNLDRMISLADESRREALRLALAPISGGASSVEFRNMNYRLVQEEANRATIRVTGVMIWNFLGLPGESAVRDDISLVYTGGKWYLTTFPLTLVRLAPP